MKNSIIFFCGILLGTVLNYTTVFLPMERKAKYLQKIYDEETQYSDSLNRQILELKVDNNAKSMDLYLRIKLDSIFNQPIK